MYFDVKNMLEMGSESGISLLNRQRAVGLQGAKPLKHGGSPERPILYHYSAVNNDAIHVIYCIQCAYEVL